MAFMSRGGLVSEPGGGEEDRKMSGGGGVYSHTADGNGNICAHAHDHELISTARLSQKASHADGD